MAEWFKAPVLKTGVGQLTVGSNPSPSACLTNKYWGGARVVEWGRLLSGCRDYKSRPRVRIPPSPPEFSRCLSLSKARPRPPGGDGIRIRPPRLRIDNVRAGL